MTSLIHKKLERKMMSEMDAAIRCLKERSDTKVVMRNLEALRAEIISVVNDLMDAMWEPATDEEQESYDRKQAKARDLLTRIEHDPVPPYSMWSDDAVIEEAERRGLRPFPDSYGDTYAYAEQSREFLADPPNPRRAVHDNEEDWWEGD